MLKGTAREAAGEFFGTFILIAFGVGVVAQTVSQQGRQRLVPGDQHRLGAGRDARHLHRRRRVGRALESGGDGRARRAPRLPVEQGAAVHRWRRSAGAFAASARGVCHLSRGVRRRLTAACAWSRAPPRTAGIFATYPQPFLSIAGGFVDQVVGTMLLMAGVLAVTDQRNTAPPAWLTGPLVGALVRGHRRRVRLQRRLRDQPRARLRPAAVHGRGRMGPRRVHRRRRLVVGAGGRAVRRRDSRRVPLRRVRQQASRRAARPADEALRAQAGHAYVLALDQGTTSSRAIVFDRVGHVGRDGAAGIPADLSGPGPRRARSRGDLVHAAADGEGRDREGRASRPPISPRSASPISARRRCCGRRRPASRSPTRSCGRAASPRRSAIG